MATQKSNLRKEDALLQADSPWKTVVKFVQEIILEPGESVQLVDGQINLILAGKVAMGKKIIDEGEFISGKSSRKIVALQTTSIFLITTERKRREIEDNTKKEHLWFNLNFKDGIKKESVCSQYSMPERNDKYFSTI